MIYGFLEDSAGLLITSFKFFSLEKSSEFIFFKIYFLLSDYFISFKLFNYFIGFLIILNLFFIYKFFKSFFSSYFISILLTFLVSFSPYLLYKSQNHLALINVWILPIFILISLKLSQEKTKLIYFFLAGIAFGITSLISNYLSFFGLLFSIIFLGLNYLVQFYKTRFNLNFLKDTLLKLFVLYFSVLIPILLVNYNFIQANFISDSSSADTSFVLKRSIDDFFIFSSRPWYYFLPSTDNPFYGEYSKSVLYYLENNWGSFLAKNYFKSEHSSSYLGIVNFILAIVGFLYLRKNKEKIENYTQIMILGLTGIILILFTMPPYLDISNFRVYFPSFLIAEFFPMFRVTARLGILILMIQLVFTGFGYKFILEKFTEIGIKKIYSFVVVLFLVVISLSEFFIPFKFTDISQIPEVYKYLKENSTKDSKLAILPRGKYVEGYFWSKDHRLELIDLEKDHLFNSNKILKDDFYNEIAFTCRGLEILRSYGANYFIYFYNVDKDSEKKLIFLNKNLEKIIEFKDIDQVDSYGNIFYTVINTGNNFSNQNILYRISDKISCQN